MGITNRGPLRERIRHLGIEVLTSAETKSIHGTAVTVEIRGQTRSIEVETVVLAVGYRPNRSLWQSLQGKLPRPHPVGDCLESGRILEAIHNGWEVGCEI